MCKSNVRRRKFSSFEKNQLRRVECQIIAVKTAFVSEQFLISLMLGYANICTSVKTSEMCFITFMVNWLSQSCYMAKVSHHQSN